MLDWQRYFLIALGIFSFGGFLLGLKKCTKDKDNLGRAGIYNLIGAFVWADAVVLGIFWTAVSCLIFLLNDWVLFLLVLSLFWAVRSLGEIIYWFNQQFTKPIIPENERLWTHKIFRDNYTVWFVMQLIWQCILVVAIIFSIYFVHLWLA